jgi:hypothetical protein
VRKFGIGVCLILLAQVFASASGAREEESFSYTGIKRIEIHAEFLNVEVRGENSPSVQMRSDLPEGSFFAPRDFDVRHEVVGTDLRVWIDRSGIFSNGRGTLFFRVPGQTELTLDTASGDVRVAGLSAGVMRVKTASGDVTVSDIDAAATVGTISGDLFARKLRGNLALTTISGDIELSGLQGRISVESVSGDIHGDTILLESSSNFKTVSGDIDIDLENPLDELRYDLSTVSGRLTVGSVGVTRGLQMGSGSLTLKGESASGSQTYR